MSPSLTLLLHHAPIPPHSLPPLPLFPWLPPSMTNSTPPSPITEYYLSRPTYTAILEATHSKLPPWRDPTARLNRKPANEPSPFGTEDDAGPTSRSIFGDEAEEAKIREGMRELAEKFRKAELLKDGQEGGLSGKGNADKKANGKK